ncbi:MAG: MBOAT family protein [Lachnospiraceae bacterium]|nr:MBOAT family protein [Lachnospiraceae bacterium]
MTFSIFTFLFLLLVLASFYGIRNAVRPHLLLAAGLIWLAVLDLKSCIAALLCTLFVYGAALLCERLKGEGKDSRARKAGNAAIILLILLLAGLKWLPFAVPVLPVSETAKAGILKNLILPLGMSYYLFQAIAYLKDVSRDAMPAEKNLFHFALYMCFFPKFLSGPIEQAQKFLPQLKRLKFVRLFEKNRMSSSFSWLLYGYFLKTVVADRLAIYTDSLFAGYPDYNSLWLLLGALMYTLQIYCDFAGYSAIAIGVGRLFGLELTQNFRSPYLAESISDFWRRWHISLSSWLRDMVYIPLGGNRKGKLRQCMHVAVVFVICGLWHGNGLQFLAWGLLHGLYSVADILIFRKKEKSRLRKGLDRVGCFAAVSFAWVFFGSESLGKAVGYIRTFLSGLGRLPEFSGGAALLGIDGTEIVILLLSVLLVLLTDIVSERSGQAFPETIRNWPYGYRYLVYYAAILIIFVFGIYGPGYDAGSFMYMEF